MNLNPESCGEQQYVASLYIVSLTLKTSGQCVTNRNFMRGKKLPGFELVNNNVLINVSKSVFSHKLHIGLLSEWTREPSCCLLHLIIVYTGASKPSREWFTNAWLLKQKSKKQRTCNEVPWGPSVCSVAAALQRQRTQPLQCRDPLCLWTCWMLLLLFE